MSPAFCAHLTNHVLTNYQSDSQLRSLLAMTELIVIPNANPDGCAYGVILSQFFFFVLLRGPITTLVSLMGRARCRHEWERATGEWGGVQT